MSNTNSSNELREQAQEAFINEDMTKALWLLGEAAKENPNNSEALRGLLAHQF